jgi:hypothetical protein
VLATAGTCTAVGVGIVGATFVGDGLKTGSWKYGKAVKGLAWTLGGGFVARGIAGSWAAKTLVRRGRVIKTVFHDEATNVTVYGYRKGIEFGGTYANVAVNVGLSGSFCGAGAASPGSAAFPGSTVSVC